MPIVSDFPHTGQINEIIEAYLQDFGGIVASEDFKATRMPDNAETRHVGFIRSLRKKHLSVL
jgi:hypothetical protein